MTKYTKNRRKIFIKKNKSVKRGNYSDLYMIKNSSKSDAVLDVSKKDKNIIESKNSPKLNKILLQKIIILAKTLWLKTIKNLYFQKKESKQIESSNVEEGKNSNSKKNKKGM